MAWTSGTANNERDLLSRLNIFLTTCPELVAGGEHWQQIWQGEMAATPTEQARPGYVWKAPGSSGQDEIFVGVMAGNSIASDTYNLFFAGGTWFNPAAVDKPENLWNGFTGVSRRVGLCCDSTPFRFWFIANGRRVIVITAVNTVYSSAYCGFMLPAVTPGEYPYPLVIAGSTDSLLRRYSLATDYNTSISDPRTKNCWLMYPDQGWRDFYGQMVTSSESGGASRYLTPRGVIRFNSRCGDVLQGMGSTPDDGNYPLYPIEFRTNETTGTNFFGALDGVYWLPGLSRAAEDIITTADGHQFLVVQNAFRVNTWDYFVVGLE